MVEQLSWSKRDIEMMIIFLRKNARNITELIVRGSLPDALAVAAEFFDTDSLELIHFTQSTGVVFDLLLQKNPSKLKSLSAAIPVDRLAVLKLQNSALEDIYLKLKIQSGISVPSMASLPEICESVFMLLKQTLAPCRPTLRSVCLHAPDGSLSAMHCLLLALKQHSSRAKDKNSPAIVAWLRAIDSELFPLRIFRSHPTRDALVSLLAESALDPPADVWLPIFDLVCGHLSPVEQFRLLRGAVEENYPQGPAFSKNSGLAKIAEQVVRTLGWPPPVELRETGLWICVGLLRFPLESEATVSGWVEKFNALVETSADFLVDCFAGKSSQLSEPIWKELLSNVEASRKTGFYKDVIRGYLPVGIHCAPHVLCHPDFDLQWIAQCEAPQIPLALLMSACNSPQAHNFPALPRILHEAFTITVEAGMQALVSTLGMLRSKSSMRPLAGAAWNIGVAESLFAQGSAMLMIQTFPDAGSYISHLLIERVYLQTGDFSHFQKILNLATERRAMIKSQIPVSPDYSDGVLERLSRALLAAAQGLAQKFPDRVDALDAEVERITGQHPHCQNYIPEIHSLASPQQQSQQTQQLAWAGRTHRQGPTSWRPSQGF